MNMFERASKLRLFFTSTAGSLTTSDLWELPLTAKPGRLSLNEVAKTAAAELKALGEENFVEASPVPGRAEAELRLEIIKHVIAERQAELLELQKAAERRAEKAELQEALKAKKSGAIMALSEEELTARIAALG